MPRPSHCSPLTALALASALVGCGTPPAVPFASDGPPAAVGLVAGTVRDPILEVALEGATVSIGGASVRTDPHGAFELSVPVGEQTLTCVKQGYAPYSAALKVVDGANRRAINLIIPAPNALTPYWQIADFAGSGPLLESWSLAADPYYKYYKLKTPLAQRQTVAEQDRPGAAVYIGFSTSGTPVAMDLGENEASNRGLIHNYTQWGRTARFVYFGGSAGEGEVLAPAPGWIKAAHQNGVPILGCIFFNDGHQDQAAWLEGTAGARSFNDPQVRQAAAQKLAAIAKAYGFDGYFVNQEAKRCVQPWPSPCEPSLANTNCASFIQELHAAGEAIDYPLLVSWYQTKADNFTPSALAAGGAQNADYVFEDYGWESFVATFSQKFKDASYPLAAVEWGINVADYPGSPPVAAGESIPRIAEGVPGLFALSQIVTSNLGNLREIEHKYSTYMEAMKAYVGLRAPQVTALPFVTFFNTGQGERYFIDGVVVSDERWNDLGQQDLLPAHRLLGGAGVHDFTDEEAYYGGASLNIGRDKGQPARRLYDVQLPITKGARLEVAYAYRGAGGTEHPGALELEVAGEATPTRHELPYKSATWTAAWTWR